MRCILSLLCIHLLAGLCLAGTMVIDQTGRRVNVPKHPKRVVSLAPNITEIVCAVGKYGVLTGVSTYSNYPDKVQKLPKIGSYAMPDPEKILRLKPDLCLAVKDGTPLCMVNTLSRLGIPVYALDIHTIQGVFTAMEDVGRLLGNPEKAGQIVAGLRKRLDHVARGPFKEPRPKVFYQIGARPMITAGQGTVINKLIALAGGENMAHNMIGYPRISIESVVSLAPDVIVIPTMGDANSREWKRQWSRWSMIPAVAAGKIFVVDSDIFDRPGPRTVQAVETLNAMLYPDKNHGEK